MNLPRLQREKVGKSERSTQEPAWVKWPLIIITAAFALVFLFLPLINVFVQAFANGIPAYWSVLTDPATKSAIRLTLAIALITVPLNVLFGLAASWLIAKFEFRGKALLL